MSIYMALFNEVAKFARNEPMFVVGATDDNLYSASSRSNPARIYIETGFKAGTARGAFKMPNYSGEKGKRAKRRLWHTWLDRLTRTGWLGAST